MSSWLQMPIRSVYVRLHIDANRINARGKLANMNRLEEWAEHEVIGILMAATAQDEAAAGNDVMRRDKAFRNIFAECLATTPGEESALAALEGLFAAGGPVTTSIRNDAEIVFTAAKYGAILVTADGGSKSQPGGILGNRQTLLQMGYRVMTDEEAVAQVRAKIAERDEISRLIAAESGAPLPDWVGKD